jgi:hypothetical protein
MSTSSLRSESANPRRKLLKTLDPPPKTARDKWSRLASWRAAEKTPNAWNWKSLDAEPKSAVLQLARRGERLRLTEALCGPAAIVCGRVRSVRGPAIRRSSWNFSLGDAANEHARRRDNHCHCQHLAPRPTRPPSGSPRDYDEACPTTSSEGVGIESPVVEPTKARKTNVNGSPKRWRTYSKESPKNKCFNFFGLHRGFVGGEPINPIQ